MNRQAKPVLIRPGVAQCETCKGTGQHLRPRVRKCDLCNGRGEFSLTWDRAAREGRLAYGVCAVCGQWARILNVGTAEDPFHVCAACEMNTHEELAQPIKVLDAGELPF